MNTLISAFTGAIVSIMILFNGTLSNASGNAASTIIIHVVGLVSILLILLFTRSKPKIGHKLPLYIYSAGFLGVLTVAFTNVGYSALGVSLPLALGLLSQSLTSIVVDHFGLMEMSVTRFNRKKIIGLLVILAGIILMSIS